MFYDEIMKSIDYLQERVESLEKEIDEKKDEAIHAKFVNNIFEHEIKNQQLAGSAYICLLNEARDEQEKADAIKNMSASFKKINNLIKELFNYQTVGHKKEDRTLSDIFNRSHNLHPHIRINISKNKIFISSTPATLIIASSLVNNTAMHGGKDVNNINVWWEKVPEGIVIIYEDNGVGVPDDQKINIFEKGIGRNNGLGLYLTREILKLSKCKIVENGIYGKGARFEIFVPDGLYKIQ